jgi:hypothetical protein
MAVWMVSPIVIPVFSSSFLFLAAQIRHSALSFVLATLLRRTAPCELEIHSPTVMEILRCEGVLPGLNGARTPHPTLEISVTRALIKEHRASGKTQPGAPFTHSS